MTDTVKVPRVKKPPAPPPQEMPDGEITDEILLAIIDRAHWHRSGGYDRSDGFPVGAHEYIVRTEEPNLFPVLQKRIGKGADSYPGSYGGHSYRYLDLDGWKYWSFWQILNREKLPEPTPEA